MDKTVIGIRADGSAQIGMGHLMRCLSIAIALKKESVQVVFITKNAESRIFLMEKGFDCITFSKEYNQMDEETEELQAIITERGISLLIVDSYNATEKYLSFIHNIIPVFYMDDLGRMGLPVTGVINYNIYGSNMGYKDGYGQKTVFILGSQYAPVKPEFLETLYDVKENVTNILVTMGGSDFLNIAGKLGERLAEELADNVQITLICGRFSPHLREIQSLAEQNSRVCVLTDVPDMWNKLAACDLAITAAGSTMYELCTMGVPSICCYYVENQRRIAEGFAEQTDMVNAGDFSAEPEAVLHKIVDETKRLMKDAVLRKALARQMKEVSDGNGALRIAQRLSDYLHKSIETR